MQKFEIKNIEIYTYKINILNIKTKTIDYL